MFNTSLQKKNATTGVLRKRSTSNCRFKKSRTLSPYQAKRRNSQLNLASWIPEAIKLEIQWEFILNIELTKRSNKFSIKNSDNRQKKLIEEFAFSGSETSSLTKEENTNEITPSKDEEEIACNKKANEEKEESEDNSYGNLSSEEESFIEENLIPKKGRKNPLEIKLKQSSCSSLELKLKLTDLTFDIIQTFENDYSIEFTQDQERKLKVIIALILDEKERSRTKIREIVFSNFYDVGIKIEILVQVLSQKLEC